LVVLVDDWPTGNDVEVVEAGGMSTPMPPTPGIKSASPPPAASGFTNTPMKSSRRRVVGTAMLVPPSPSMEISAERTCGEAGGGESRRRSTPA
jgi:hypothetical protein